MDSSGKGRYSGSIARYWVGWYSTLGRRGFGTHDKEVGEWEGTRGAGHSASSGGD